MIIIRTGPPYYLLIIDKLSNDIPKTQILNAGKDIESVLPKVQYAPIFGAYYLVILEYQKGQQFWKELKEIESIDYVKLILTTKTKDDFNTVINKSESSKFDYWVYDSYKASKRDKNIYIIKTIKSYNNSVILSNEIIDVIRKRLNGYSYEINGYLQQLAFVSDLSSKNIMKLIPKKNVLTPASFGWMLYSGDLSIKEADAIIYRYKYYPHVLIESIKKYTDKIIDIIPYYLSGEFTEYNYEKFAANNKKLISSQFIALTYLDIFKIISIERLYKISAMLNNSNGDRVSDILLLYKVVRLITGNI